MSNLNRFRHIPLNYFYRQSDIDTLDEIEKGEPKTYDPNNDYDHDYDCILSRKKCYCITISITLFMTYIGYLYIQCLSN